MKIVETDDAFEIHISSAVTDNYVVANNKRYNYKRLVIPNLIINFFFENKPNTKYVYLYFLKGHIFISYEKLSDIKFSRRKLMKIKGKNSFFIDLNLNSLSKYGIVVSDSVLFKIVKNDDVNFDNNVVVELVF